MVILFYKIVERESQSLKNHAIKLMVVERFEVAYYMVVVAGIFFV